MLVEGDGTASAVIKQLLAKLFSHYKINTGTRELGANFKVG